MSRKEIDHGFGEIMFPKSLDYSEQNVLDDDFGKHISYFELPRQK